MSDKTNILFFDGVCNLCNTFIDFVIRWDKSGKIKVSSLQGETAKKLLSQKYTQVLDTVVLYKNGKVYTKSNAAIRVLLTINAVFYPLAVFLILPSFLRDPFYNLVAKLRYKWFGKRSSCRLPSPEEKKFFLP